MSMTSSPRSARDTRAVIFDMDGLIVDSEPFWRRVEAAVFDELGVDVRPHLGHGLTMGLRVDDAVLFLSRATGIELDDVESITRRVVEGVVEAISAEAELLPGVFESLDLFASCGLRIGLASGSVPLVIEAVLERLALAERFEIISSAIDDLYGKPHPSIFLRTAGALGVDPVSCVVLEDSLNGCIAAKAARMGVIAIPHLDDADDPRYAIADLQLRSLEEIADGRVEELFALKALSS